MKILLKIKQVYYRQNTYLESCQFCDGEDFKLLLPMTITTLLASIIGFLASSPLLEDHPRKVLLSLFVDTIVSQTCTCVVQISGLGGLLGIAAVELSRIRNKKKMNARSVNMFGMCVVQLEQMLTFFVSVNRAEQFRSAALQYRMLATSLEEKLCAYERLPVKSKARDLAADEWRVIPYCLMCLFLKLT